ncbi:MAG TPA: GNAT family N-acetyltransferase [Gaiellaceae bacterium]|nr:GNAT family N-acetyltransferase [Gaiellaceae bacterium]
MLELEEGARVAIGDYRRFREAVGWDAPAASDAAVQAALDATWNVVAREDGELVGIGRLLDDGAMYATIWDMIVLPGEQGHGVGRAILEKLLARASVRSIVMLVATNAGRSLYEKYGFVLESRGSVGMLLRPE